MQDQDPPFNYDFERMQASLESGTISFPRGLSREERMKFISERLEEIDKQQEAE